MAGMACPCHSMHDPPTVDGGFWIGPTKWATTPAEEDVDPKRIRKVRFADKMISSVEYFEPWYAETWGDIEDIADDSTKADDDLEDPAIDSPPSLPVDGQSIALDASDALPPPSLDDLIAKHFGARDDWADEDEE